MCIATIYNIVGAGYDLYRKLRYWFASKHSIDFKMYKEQSGEWDCTGVSRNWIWIHGASMGEVNSLLPIAQELKSLGYAIVFSAVTRTGVEKAQQQGYESHFFPLDRYCYWKKLLGSLPHPRAILFGETELWPNFIQAMSEANIPLVLANARLSSTSVKRYGYIRSIMSRVLSSLALIACGSKLSANRFLQLGAAPDNVIVTGNAKYDVAPRVFEAEEIKKRYFDRPWPLITLGSIRPGEEVFWFDVIKKFENQNVLWAVVPRHPERFSFFAQELQKRAIQFSKFSDRQFPTSSNVLLVDYMGVIEEFYASSSAAFVGGTLCPHLGGHNLFEPARYAVPVIAGPEGETIKDIREELIGEQGMIVVDSVESIERVIRAVLEGKLVDIGKTGYEVYARHTGATKKLIQALHSRKILP